MISSHTLEGKCQNKFSNKENHDSEQNICGSEVFAPELALLSLYKSHQGFSKSNSKRWFINVHPPRNYGIYEIFGTNFETKAMPAVILKSENNMLFRNLSLSYDEFQLIIDLLSFENIQNNLVLCIKIIFDPRKSFWASVAVSFWAHFRFGIGNHLSKIF